MTNIQTHFHVSPVGTWLSLQYTYLDYCYLLELYGIRNLFWGRLICWYQAGYIRLIIPCDRWNYLSKITHKLKMLHKTQVSVPGFWTVTNGSCVVYGRSTCLCTYKYDWDCSSFQWMVEVHVCVHTNMIGNVARSSGWSKYMFVYIQIWLRM